MVFFVIVLVILFAEKHEAFPKQQTDLLFSYAKIFKISAVLQTSLSQIRAFPSETSQMTDGTSVLLSTIRVRSAIRTSFDRFCKDFSYRLMILSSGTSCPPIFTRFRTRRTLMALSFVRTNTAQI